MLVESFVKPSIL